MFDSIKSFSNRFPIKDRQKALEKIRAFCEENHVTLTPDLKFEGSYLGCDIKGFFKVSDVDVYLTITERPIFIDNSEIVDRARKFLEGC